MLIFLRRGKLPALILPRESEEASRRKTGVDWLGWRVISGSVSGLRLPLNAFLTVGQSWYLGLSTGVSRPEKDDGVSLPLLVGVSRPDCEGLYRYGSWEMSKPDWLCGISSLVTFSTCFKKSVINGT